MNQLASIERLVEDGVVDEIMQRVKTGKEAEVFVVRKGDKFWAAKVYKERTQRNFRNNVGYMEGRATRNSRDTRAMAKRTKYGVDKAETEWMRTEHDALMKAHAAGIRVPQPELFYEGVLLMELVLDGAGQPAPRLSELMPTREEALVQHKEIVSFIVKMLCLDLIHGDLSPFNILFAWNGPTIIDMPQVVKAAHNSQAEQFLLRDVKNVAMHFAKAVPELKKRENDGHQIWRAYMKRELTPDWMPDENAVVFVPKREHVADAPRPAAPRPPGPPRQGQPGQPRPPQGQSQGQHRPREGHQSHQHHSPNAPAPAPGRPPQQQNRPPQQHRAPQPNRPPASGGQPPQSQRPQGQRPSGQQPQRHQRPPRRGDPKPQ